MNEIEELKSLADQIRGYAERIESAASHEQLFWTETELAEMLNERGVKVSVLTIQRKRRSGEIPFKRIAGTPVFTRRHIEEFLGS